MTNKQMIVKVQVPIASNMSDPMALLYNEDKKFERYLPVDDSMKKLMRGSLKKFFLIEVTPSRQVKFIKQVDDPGW